ncbi:MAG: hypothetical protein K2L94_02255 [Alphaproteobacteria bacterium]|nr:hypothetical protein [Alphaproteobacteria bacterium]
MNKNIVWLCCMGMLGVLGYTNAHARTCNATYTVMCPIREGEVNCCRASNETCAAAGCPTSGTITPIDPVLCPSECPTAFWTTVSGQNYSVRCSDGACEYQCNAGYYGKGQSCSPCPEPGTSAVGRSSIFDCFLMDGTSGTDNTGDWTISGGNCYYGSIL